MSSRDKILATVKSNQPEPRELPEIPAGGVFPGATSGVSASAPSGVSASAPSNVPVGAPSSVSASAPSGVSASASSSVSASAPSSVSAGATSSVPAGAPSGVSAGASSSVSASAPSSVPAGAPSSVSASASDASDDLAPIFIAALEAIGGAAFVVSGFDRIATILHEKFPSARRVVSGRPQLAAFAETASSGLARSAGAVSAEADPHLLEDVDLAILPAHFAVAENGACWITDSQMIERVLPFITQHLALVVPRQAIVANMHQAYERIAAIEGIEGGVAIEGGATIEGGAAGTEAADTAGPGTASYGFSTFIAGPSKTADIEQSLVLGAHGPTSLTVFLLDEQLSDAGFY